MQDKITMKYHLILIRMVIIKKSKNIKYWRGYGKKVSSCTLVGMPIDIPLWNTVWSFLKKIKNRTIIRSRNPTPGHIPRENIIPKDTCTPVFIAAPPTTARTWRQPICPPTEEWIKMWYVYTMKY